MKFFQSKQSKEEKLKFKMISQKMIQILTFLKAKIFYKKFKRISKSLILILHNAQILSSKLKILMIKKDYLKKSYHKND